jgi:hypothetical protein
MRRLDAACAYVSVLDPGQSGLDSGNCAWEYAALSLTPHVCGGPSVGDTRLA